MTVGARFQAVELHKYFVRQLALIASGGLLLAVAVSFDLKNDGMVYQSVNSCDRRHRVGKNAVPLAEGLISSDEQTFALIAMSNEFEEN